MKKHNPRIYILPLVALLAILIGGCSSGSKLACPESDEVIAYADPREGLVALTVENTICMSVCQLLVSPDHCEYMGGADWVDDHPLRSGESITMYVQPGKYAVWLETCAERFRADEGLKVFSDSVHTILDDPEFGSKLPCETSLTVVNKADVDICSLWISNSESAYASWNWIGAEHIQPGESLVLALRSDTYQLRAEACDGTWLRAESDVSLSGHQTWTVP